MSPVDVYTTGPDQLLGPWKVRPNLPATDFYIFPQGDKWFARRQVEIAPPAERARSIYLTRHQQYTKTREIPVEGFWFPVAPPTYDVQVTSDWNELKVIGLGTVAHPAGNQAYRVSFSGFFPGTYDPEICLAISDSRLFLESTTNEPASVRYINILKKIIEKQDLFKLTIHEAPLTITARILDFTYKEDVGQPENRGFSITFGGWRAQELRIRKGAQFFDVPRTYRPQKGEDLRDVALRWYGKEAAWKVIAKKNGIKVTPKASIPASKKVLKLPRPTEVF